MIQVLTVDNMRKSDTNTIKSGILGRELMFRAGEAIFQQVEWKAPVTIVCGSGNNAGDGYVIARLLHENSVPCNLLLLSEHFSEDGKYYYDQCCAAGIPVYHYVDTGNSAEIETLFRQSATILDCIFGTGFQGEIKEPIKSVIETINRSNAYIVSVDINSGLNGDNGMCETCVVSDLTISIGSFQPGHFLNMAKDVMKKKVNCDIGIKPVNRPYHLVEAGDVAAAFPERKNLSNKSTYGYIALIGGSKNYSGAIRLSFLANAAMRSGAGVVQLAVPDSISPALMPLILESTLYPLSDKDGQVLFIEEEIAGLISKVKTIAFGMGIGISDEVTRMLQYLLEHYTGTLIIDADGLTALSKLDEKILANTKCTVVLTPHNKEFSRLLHCEVTEVLKNPIGLAEPYVNGINVLCRKDKHLYNEIKTGSSDEYSKLILLLKGPTTIITNGKNTCLVDTGCPGMATAGSGDVLTGILAALCGYNHDTFLAVAASAYVNGRAGELAQSETNAISMTAGDTVRNIPKIISEIIS